MMEFAYNNTKNNNTGYTNFELSCKYHPCVSCKKDLNPRFKSKTVKELSSKLQKLMIVY